MNHTDRASISGVTEDSRTLICEGDEADPSPQSEIRQVCVPVSWHGQRIDRALADAVPEFSRSYLQQLIELGAVEIGGIKVLKASLKVKAGELLIVELKPTPQSQAFKPEQMALDIVFEDTYLRVVNKPAGLVVHPAPGNWSGTLLNGLLAHDVQASGLPRAGIVHRLDKDTSGLMVVARQRQTMDQLVEMIAARAVSREYIALVHGPWQGEKNQLLNSPIGRDPRNRLRMAVVDLSKNAGKLASTSVAMVATSSKFSLVHCKLHTGRTHQIRVHLAEIGHPLVADLTYGGDASAGLVRQGLHAVRLALRHPATGEDMVFNMEAPRDMRDSIEQLGLHYTKGHSNT